MKEPTPYKLLILLKDGNAQKPATVKKFLLYAYFMDATRKGHPVILL